MRTVGSLVLPDVEHREVTQLCNQLKMAGLFNSFFSGNCGGGTIHWHLASEIDYSTDRGLYVPNQELRQILTPLLSSAGPYANDLHSQGVHIWEGRGEPRLIHFADVAGAAPGQHVE